MAIQTPPFMPYELFLFGVGGGLQFVELHGAKGRKTANGHSGSALGWVLIRWALGLIDSKSRCLRLRVLRFCFVRMT